MTQNKKYIFGITGGTGSGKSSVAGLFVNYNAYILDMDKLGHEVLASSAYQDIIDRFGTNILNNDGTINRKKLGSIVFSDPKSLNNLNSIVHPKIKELVYIRTTTLLKEKDIIVLDGALIFDVGLNHICTHTILVLAHDTTRINRIIKRDGIDKNQAKNRIKSQRDYNQLVNLVDIIVQNN